ncbi:MAG: hypothetical protein ACPIA7_07005 [Akkermansiaceae bacterium]
MSDIQSIENKLSELIPSSVSQQGLDQMDMTLDRLSQETARPDLGGIESGADTAGIEIQWRRLVQWRIAAVLAILVVSSLFLATVMGVLEVSLKTASSEPIEQSGPPAKPIINRPVVLSADSSLSISDNEETATLTYKEDKPWLCIESAEGNKTYDGFINGAEGVAKMPAAWRDRINVDEQAIEISMHEESHEKSAEGRKRLRIRYVPNFNRAYAGNELD